jgi:hypothetical protein
LSHRLQAERFQVTFLSTSDCTCCQVSSNSSRYKTESVPFYLDLAGDSFRRIVKFVMATNWIKKGRENMKHRSQHKYDKWLLLLLAGLGLPFSSGATWEKLPPLGFKDCVELILNSCKKQN